MSEPRMAKWRDLYESIVLDETEHEDLLDECAGILAEGVFDSLGGKFKAIRDKIQGRNLDDSALESLLKRTAEKSNAGSAVKLWHMARKMGSAAMITATAAMIVASSMSPAKADEITKATLQKIEMAKPSEVKLATPSNQEVKLRTPDEVKLATPSDQEVKLRTPDEVKLATPSKQDVKLRQIEEPEAAHMNPDFKMEDAHTMDKNILAMDAEPEGDDATPFRPMLPEDDEEYSDGHEMSVSMHEARSFHQRMEQVRRSALKALAKE